MAWAAATWEQALLGFERLCRVKNHTLNTVTSVKEIKHRPWNGELVRETADELLRRREQVQRAVARRARHRPARVGADR